MARSTRMNLALMALLGVVSAQTITDVSLISVVPTATSIPTATDVSSPEITATATASPSASASASATGDSSDPKVHKVNVGSGGFTFDPAELKNVEVGDTIEYTFFPKDHSVARAAFGSACVPYEYTADGAGKEGFFSETQWLSTGQTSTWNLTINSTEPIFVYCAAPGSCIDHQMVAVINPNSTQTLKKQMEAAGKADYMVAPGEDIPAEGTQSLHTPSATGAASTEHNESHGHKLSGGAIAGIAVGGVAFLIIAAALFFYIGRAKSLKEVLKHNRESTIKGPPAGTPGTEYGAPGYPASPFSPSPNMAEHGGQLPPYGQHNATDSNGGWMSPQAHPGHMSMASAYSQAPQSKPEQYNAAPAEMASPVPNQQRFTAELEAPVKSPR